MTDRLYTSAEAAGRLNSRIDRSTFQRYADRLGVPYHKIGRERYYDADGIEAVKKGTMKCPDKGTGPAYASAEAHGSSAGQKADRHASVAQARAAAKKLRQSLRTGSQAAESDRPANVVRLTI